METASSRASTSSTRTSQVHGAELPGPCCCLPAPRDTPAQGRPLGGHVGTHSAQPLWPPGEGDWWDWEPREQTEGHSRWGGVPAPPPQCCPRKPRVVRFKATPRPWGGCGSAPWWPTGHPGWGQSVGQRHAAGGSPASGLGHAVTGRESDGCSLMRIGWVVGGPSKGPPP